MSRERSTRILVKLRATTSLRAAESRANLRPLYDATAEEDSAVSPLGVAPPGQSRGNAPRWYLADVPDGRDNPWDLAHARLADQLGVAESDVLFAEPDLIQPVQKDPFNREAQGLPLGEECTECTQEDGGGRAKGPDTFAWHLGDDFTQLKRAREEVEFTDRRTRIAHFDTGYYRDHVTLPKHIRTDLERNFADGDEDSADDPGKRRLLLDNAGHGTGTLSILAGGRYPRAGGEYMGAAPGADVVPIRVARSVILLRTSAFARALDYARTHDCDVVAMSMGGLPSNAWKEAVDDAYLAGVCIVSAAGNNYSGVLTRNIVYPARYGRVIAVVGVMADGRPYADLDFRTMEGNHGPSSKMSSAIAAYTPNIPWARFGCPEIVRLNGEGTSAATPQVAAAAALWLEKYKGVLRPDWRRVEAVRHALFSKARGTNSDRSRLGNGILRAHAALAVEPDLERRQTKSDSDWLPALRVITGLGVAEPPPRERMFNLEFAQRWLLNPALQALLPDPDADRPVDERALRALMEAVIEDSDASLALRRQVVARYPLVTGRMVPTGKAPADVVPPVLAVTESTAPPRLVPPAQRRVRVYAVDPSFSTKLDSASANDVRLNVRWEKLAPGPVGEYLEVSDVDALGNRHAPVDLNAPELLAQDGWAPSEGNPQFHQQMVYAVAMKTIEHFERALGRPVLWRPRPSPKRPNDDSQFVRRLAVHPHAIRHANAFYSPQDVALQFGYFEAPSHDPGELVPGSRIYACLSHDIIAHETTHAVLDGMHRRFTEPSNLDVLAFHEAFADIIALMQHFTIPEILEREIARSRGDLESESILGSLAVQFGRAVGGHAALRDAIGRVENGVWQRFAADATELARRETPHARGAILVAAVFDAFLAIYRTRSADLLRLYTAGTGVLPNGAIHPDLVQRLAREAATSARHVLGICIRALDYLPPVDVTFFEYLRALITADFDVVAEDPLNYRVAFVEAFRRRGIYPVDMGSVDADTPRTLAPDTLRWKGLDEADLSAAARVRIEQQYAAMISGLKEHATACIYLRDREALFDATRAQRRSLHGQLAASFAESEEFCNWLGLVPKRSFEVHELRCALRSRPDGTTAPQIVIALTQSMRIKRNAKTGAPAHHFLGGSTLLVDLVAPRVSYRIVKRISSVDRQARTAAFVRQTAADPLRALFYSPDRKEPFAALHALGEAGV